MDFTIWIWLSAAVLFGVVEALTAGLLSIWFVFGAVMALLAAYLRARILVQLIVFVSASGLALLLTRPLVKKLQTVTPTATNLDRVIGKTGKVTEAVDNDNSAGAVYVDGKTWTARSEDGSVIPVDSRVKIVRMEGVKLFVTLQ